MIKLKPLFVLSSDITEKPFETITNREIAVCLLQFTSAQNKFRPIPTMLMQGVKITCPRTHIGPRNLTRYCAQSLSPHQCPSDPQYTYDLIKIQPLSPLIGAEIDGINLHEPISAEVAKEIRQALLEWKVIFFRDQHEMTLDDQVLRWKVGN